MRQGMSAFSKARENRLTGDAARRIEDERQRALRVAPPVRRGDPDHLFAPHHAAAAVARAALGENEVERTLIHSCVEIGGEPDNHLKIDLRVPG